MVLRSPGYPLDLWIGIWIRGAESPEQFLACRTNPKASPADAFRNRRVPDLRGRRGLRPFDSDRLIRRLSGLGQDQQQRHQCNQASANRHRREPATTLRLRPPAFQLTAGLGRLQPRLEQILLAAKTGQGGVGHAQLLFEILDLLSRQLTLHATGLLQQLCQPIATPLILGHRGIHLHGRALHLLKVRRRIAAKDRGRPVSRPLPRALGLQQEAIRFQVRYHLIVGRNAQRLQPVGVASVGVAVQLPPQRMPPPPAVLRETPADRPAPRRKTDIARPALWPSCGR